MIELQDLINETRRRVMPTQRGPILILNQTYIAGASSITFTDNSVNSAISSALQVGMLLAIDLELFLVLGPATSGVVPVQPGWNGSTEANHSDGALIYVNPRFSDFDILTAINHDLDDLCSPGRGLYAISQIQIIYNPVLVGYDLTDVNTNEAISGLIDIIALYYKTPLPDQKRRGIPETMWSLISGLSEDSTFPSGYALNIFEGWPGMPVNVIFRQAFSHLANYTDNVQTVTGLPASANDLPVIGASIILNSGREIERNQIQSQPDPRNAPEVPAGAIINSANALLRLQQSRTTNEAAKLKALTGRMRIRR